MSSAWFSPHIPLRINAKKFNLGLIRPENLISHSLGVLHVFFGKLSMGFHMSCTEERLPSGHSAIKALLRLLSLAGRPGIGRVLVIPNFFHLRIMEATVLLGTLSATEILL